MAGKLFPSFSLALLAILAGWGATAAAGFGGGGQGYDGYVNIIVREVKVSPVRAHVGDAITVDMVVEDQGDSYYANVPAEIIANGKVVARTLVTYGLGGEGDRVRRQTLRWNTTGAKPGAYRVGGQVFVWPDASPFDNFLTVAEPVVLLPPGAPFPDGQSAGGAAIARDPRYKAGGASATGPSPPSGTGGY